MIDRNRMVRRRLWSNFNFKSTSPGSQIEFPSPMPPKTTGVRSTRPISHPTLDSAFMISPSFHSTTHSQLVDLASSSLEKTACLGHCRLIWHACMMSVQPSRAQNSSHLISSRLISSHLISSHLISSEWKRMKYARDSHNKHLSSHLVSGFPPPPLQKQVTLFPLAEQVAVASEAEQNSEQLASSSLSQLLVVMANVEVTVFACHQYLSP